MRCVVCALAKNENLYINEWCHHYFDIGFKKIYIFDNNDLDKPFIGDYIDKTIRNKVVIIDKRGIRQWRLLHKVYQEFYDTYKNTFEWCLFCDCDEFLTGVSDINAFVSQDKFNDYDQIRIKWKVFGDDEMLERDTRQPVHGTFKKVVNDATYSNSGKCMVRGRLSPLEFSSCQL